MRDFDPPVGVTKQALVFQASQRPSDGEPSHPQGVGQGCLGDLENMRQR